MISRTFVFFLWALLLFSGGMSVACSQDSSATMSRSQPTSLGDAARKARAQKKGPSKPAKVFTNDDMGRPNHKHSVVSSHSPPAVSNHR